MTRRVQLTPDQRRILDACAASLWPAHRTSFLLDALCELGRLGHAPSNADVSRTIEDLLGVLPLAFDIRST